MLSLKHAYLTERFVAVFDSEFPGPVDFLLLRLGQAVGIDILDSGLIVERGERGLALFNLRQLLLVIEGYLTSASLGSVGKLVDFVLLVLPPEPAQLFGCLL